MKRLDFQALCEQLLNSHNDIFIATVLHRAKPIAQALKTGVPAPSEDELNRMYLQGMTILIQGSANEQMYGRVESVTITHEKVKGLLVPLDDEHYIGIGCTKSCNADDIRKDIIMRIAANEVNA